MKDTILKIAKCKDGASFYKKFPTEEAFMKVHGKEFKLAQAGLSDVDTSIGTTYPGLKNYDFGNQRTPLYDNNYTADAVGGFANPKSFTNTPMQVNAYNPQGDQANTPMAQGIFEGAYNVPKSTMGTNSMPGAGQITGAIEGVGNAISAFREQKNQRRSLEQQNAVASLGLKAMSTLDVDSQRQQSEMMSRRREDFMPVNTGEEFFPIQGVGTNVLAQNGAQLFADTDQHLTYAPRRGGEIQNTYSPEYTLYDDLEDAQFGGSFSGFMGAGGTDFANNMVSRGFKGNAGSQAGMAAGNIVKMIPGVGPVVGAIAAPVLGAIGGTLDNVFGDAGKIKKQQSKLNRTTNQFYGSGVGKGVQQQYSSFVQDGGELLGGDLQTHWGGEAELVSYNPYLPQGGETIEFKGDMHNGSKVPGQSGIGITYGNAPVEVEGGEQATILEGEDGQENLTVYGNLKIPKGMLGDKDADNKKFKNYIKGVSDKEKKANKSLSRNVKELDELTPITSFDKLKMRSLEANILGNNMKLKDYAEKKQNAATLQKSINDTAEHYGIVADDLVRGKITKDTGKFTPSNQTAQDGADLPMYQGGGNAGKKINKSQVADYLKRGYKQDPKNPKRLYKEGTTGSNTDIYVDKEVITKIPESKTTKVIPGVAGVKDTYDGSGGYMPNKEWTAWLKTPAGIKYLNKTKGTPARTEEVVIPASETKTIEKVKDTNVVPNTPGDEVYYDEGAPLDVMQVINATLPMWRPTDQEAFDNNRLSGEMFALSHNQVEPVWAQGYRPDLRVPYDISLQDQLNAVTSQTRAGQRMAGYNPAAQSIMGGAGYDASTKILADQFRQNQSFKDQIYSGNVAALNDAQLKNLQIYDTQAGRQSQARSNTKEATQLALNSIDEKMNKHNLANRTLGVAEDMYNYRYTDKGRAQNWNPLAQFDTQYTGNGSGTSKAEQLVQYQEAIKRIKKDLGQEDDYEKIDPKAQKGKTISKMPLVRALKMY